MKRETFRRNGSFETNEPPDDFFRTFLFLPGGSGFGHSGIWKYSCSFYVEVRALKDRLYRPTRTLATALYDTL